LPKFKISPLGSPFYPENPKPLKSVDNIPIAAKIGMIYGLQSLVLRYFSIDRNKRFRYLGIILISINDLPNNLPMFFWRI